MMIDPSTLLPNLRHWTFHVVLNATPSFLLAWQLADQHRLARAVAMGVGVACFFVAYTLVSSSRVFIRRIRPSSFGQALRAATRLRTGVAVLAMVGVLPLPGVSPLCAPFVMGEVGAGMLALGIVEACGRLPWISQLRVMLTGPVAAERAASVWLGGMTSIIPTFLTTLVEGLILSLLLLGIALLIAGIQRVIQRMTKAHSCSDALPAPVSGSSPTPPDRP